MLSTRAGEAVVEEKVDEEGFERERRGLSREFGRRFCTSPDQQFDDGGLSGDRHNPGQSDCQGFCSQRVPGRFRRCRAEGAPTSDVREDWRPRVVAIDDDGENESVL